MITCPNCSNQNPADAKFCQNCGHSLEIVCSNCQTPNATDANFCKNCGLRLATPETPLPAPTDGMESGTRTGEAERRFVTILFCDVVGSTSVGELLDPEEWSEIMTGMFERLIPVVSRYGGTVSRLMGDAVLALFGAPVAHEDDPYRAILAAVDMLEAARPYQERVRNDLARSGVIIEEPNYLEVRIGINTGLAVVGEIGADEKREYTAMGDAVNLAARMEQTAQPGTIQISQDTYMNVKTRIQAEALDPLVVKGKRKPVFAYRVTGLDAPASLGKEFSGGESLLVGRDKEIKHLAKAIADLHEGEGQIITLIGEGGIGKSRLVAELSRLADEHPAPVNWYMAESLSFEGSQPYGLIQRLLRRASGISRDDAPDAIGRKMTALLRVLAPQQRSQLETVLQALFGLQSGRQQSQLQGEEFKRELFDGMQSLVRAWAADKPTILVFEDLHWSDSASVELVSHLLALTSEVPLLLVCVFREYATSAAWPIKEYARSAFTGRYKEIKLQPLTAEASNNLIGNLLDISELPPEIGQLIADKATGVPYFIEELVRDLVERGVLVRAGEKEVWQAAIGLDEIEIPDNLEAVLVSRMDRLDHEARRTLQLAAVIGRSFFYRVLKMIAGRKDELDQELKQLQQTGMILEQARVPELQYIFRHALAQEAAYNTILFRRRRQYHRQVGEAIEELFAGQVNEQAPLLAYHFHQAGDNQRALPYYQLAAENAARLYANEEAVLHYNKAIDIIGSHAQEDVSLALLHHERGLILEVLGEFEEARTDLEIALQIARSAGDDTLVWRLLLDLGNLWTSRDYVEARDYYEEALQLARNLDDPEALARNLNRLGNWYANAEHPQQAITFHQEALEIIEQLDDIPGLANTLDLLGMANLLAGNNIEAHHFFDRAVALFRELDDRFRLAGSLATRRAGVTYNELADMQSIKMSEAAEKSANEALQLSKEIGWLAGEAFAYWFLSLNNVLLGRYKQGLAMANRGLQIATEIGHRQWMASHEFVLGVFYCDILAGQKAQRHSERALELARETGSQYWTNQAVGVLARSYLLQGKLSHCRTILSTVLNPSTPMDSHSKRFCWLRRTELALAEGEAEFALEIINRLAASFSSSAASEIPALWGLHAEALAAVGRTDEAETIFRSALEHRCEGYPQFWRLYASLGNLYWKMGRQTEAREAYTAGRRDVSALAMAVPDERLRANFLERAYKHLKPPD